MNFSTNMFTVKPEYADCFNAFQVPEDIVKEVKDIDEKQQAIIDFAGYEEMNKAISAVVPGAIEKAIVPFQLVSMFQMMGQTITNLDSIKLSAQDLDRKSNFTEVSVPSIENVVKNIFSKQVSKTEETISPKSENIAEEAPSKLSTPTTIKMLNDNILSRYFTLKVVEVANVTRKAYKSSLYEKISDDEFKKSSLLLSAHEILAKATEFCAKAVTNIFLDAYKNKKVS
jgi:hypothetical protein